MTGNRRTTPESARRTIRAADAADLEDQVLAFTRTRQAWAALAGTPDVRFVPDVLERCPSAVLTRPRPEEAAAPEAGARGYHLEITDPDAFAGEVRARLAALTRERREAVDHATEEPRPLSPRERIRHAIDTGDWRGLALTPENSPELFGRVFVGGQRIGTDPRRDRRNRP